MADTLQEMADIPKDFFKDGTAFLNRCTKRTLSPTWSSFAVHPYACWCKLATFTSMLHLQPTYDPLLTQYIAADRREFIKISQAVGMGFLIMGAIGYVIKLIHIPVNNILVGAA